MKVDKDTATLVYYCPNKDCDCYDVEYGFTHCPYCNTELEWDFSNPFDEED